MIFDDPKGLQTISPISRHTIPSRSALCLRQPRPFPPQSLSATTTTTTTNLPLRRLTSAFPPFLTTALLPLLLQNPAVKGLAFALVDVPSYNVPLVTWHDNANVNAATAAISPHKWQKRTPPRVTLSHSRRFC
ncbi:MAG: hypothetical protein J0L63_00370 [Anaerolineae bacterium]|nr:hypothetical protein [Anaerolineae bacterium]